MKSIKTTLFLNFALMASLCISGALMTSCSSSDGDDDNVVTLETPAYEGEAAKYVINSTGASYKSVELTASGEYIVITSTSPFSVKSMNSFEENENMFFNYQGFITRASTTNGIIYGKFTKIGDGEYNLEGFGTIKIQSKGGSAYSLDIKPTGGQTYTMTAAKQNKNEGSTMTNNLCRSWKFDSIRFQLSYAGKSVDKTVSFDNQYDLYLAVAQTWPEMMGQNVMSREEFDKSGESLFKSNPPQKIVFTKSGTYMVEYKQQQLAVATWVWEDEASGKLRYSWNYANMNDSKMSGTATINFSGSTLSIREREVQNEGMSLIFTWNLSEVR